MSLVIFLSIFGNMLVCVAVCNDSNLRKIGNLFVVSLAIADLFVACLVMTFALVNDILGFWPFGDRYCQIWISFDVMCSTASILFLCAISLDRYIHIKVRRVRFSFLFLLLSSLCFLKFFHSSIFKHLLYLYINF